MSLLTRNCDKLNSLLSFFGYSHLVSEPTHFTKNSSSLLDVLFCNSPYIFSDVNVVDCPESDHCAFVASLKFFIKTSKKYFKIPRCLNEKK